MVFQGRGGGVIIAHLNILNAFFFIKGVEFNNTVYCRHTGHIHGFIEGVG